MADLRGFRASLAVLEMGFETVGSIAGIATYVPSFRRVGCYGNSDRTGTEPSTVAEDFFNVLWAAAIRELEQRAHAAGADGVVGVTVKQQPADIGWQLQLSGTGVRLPSQAALRAPFLSLLSMRDFITLLAAGWMPCGLAWGHGASHIHAGSSSPLQQRLVTKNGEMPGPTRAVNEARGRAERALVGSLQHCRATGATGVSVTIDRLSQTCTGRTGARRVEGSVVLAHVVGTGIVRYRDSVIDIQATRQLNAEAGA